MALSVAEVNSDLNIFGNSSYRTKSAAVTVETASTAGERLLRLCGGGDAVYATTANKGHTEILFMWKMENSAFQQKKTMVYFPHYFIGDTIAIPLILEKQGVRKIE